MTKTQRKANKAYRAKHGILQKKHTSVGKIKSKYLFEENENE